MEALLYTQYAEVENQHWWHRGRRAIIKAALSKLGLPRNQKVLSVGCGTGAELNFLKSYGKVTAVDMSEEALNFAKRIKGVTLRLGALPKLPFKAKSFDFIFCSEVLEHVADDVSSLQEIHRLLTKGGVAVFTVPAFGWLWSDHDIAAQHIRRYTLKELDGKAASAGLETVNITYINFFLFPLFAAVVLTAKLLDLQRSKVTFKIPPKPLNELLYQCFALERNLVNHLRLPFGGTILMIARKKP